MKTTKPKTRISIIQKQQKVLCKLTEEGLVEPFIFCTADAIDITESFDDGSEVIGVPDSDIFSLSDWFDYRYSEIEDPFDPNGLWLAPNRHSACKDIDSLLATLQSDARKWKKIQQLLADQPHAIAQLTSDSMGSELKRDLLGLVRILNRFQNYEIVEE